MNYSCEENDLNTGEKIGAHCFCISKIFTEWLCWINMNYVSNVMKSMYAGKTVYVMLNVRFLFFATCEGREEQRWGFSWNHLHTCYLNPSKRTRDILRFFIHSFLSLFFKFIFSIKLMVQLFFLLVSPLDFRVHEVNRFLVFFCFCLRRQQSIAQVWCCVNTCS